MHLLREVEEKVNRPFEAKLAETQEVIKHHFEEFGDKVAVAFSGGKDSEVVLWLCLQVTPNVPVVFNNTGVEYPETVRFVAEIEAKWNLNLTVTRPEKSFWDCVKQYGFPDGTKRKGLKGKRKNRPYCCYWLKEKPMFSTIRHNGWLGYFTGETAIVTTGTGLSGICLHLKKEKVCKIKPILWWTRDEVWDFIRSNNLPFNPVYLGGEKRVGCMPCTAYQEWEERMMRVKPKPYRLIKLRKDDQYVMELT